MVLIRYLLDDWPILYLKHKEPHPTWLKALYALLWLLFVAQCQLRATYPIANELLEHHSRSLLDSQQ